jgi:hypothetical protein
MRQRDDKLMSRKDIMSMPITKKIRIFLGRYTDKEFTAEEIARIMKENLSKIRESLRYLKGRGEVIKTKNGKFKINKTKEPETEKKEPLAPRIKKFLLVDHKKEVFTAEDIAKSLGEMRDIVLQRCQDLARREEIGRVGEKPVYFGSFEAVEKKRHLMDIAPFTIDEAKNMDPFDFQEWVCDELGAEMSDTRSKEKGIDGWLTDGIPIQIKRSENAGRGIVDKFETAIKRAGKNKGKIFALSFTKDANDETIRAKKEDELDIELKKVEDFL